jgi:hypothetical protein
MNAFIGISILLTLLVILLDVAIVRPLLVRCGLRPAKTTRWVIFNRDGWITEDALSALSAYNSGKRHIVLLLYPLAVLGVFATWIIGIVVYMILSLCT